MGIMRNRIETNDFLVFVKTLAGQKLHTLVRKSEFQVRVDGDDLIFTPLSTKKPRLHNHAYIKSALEQFNRTGSLKPGDYSGKTANASYVLALMAHYLENQALSYPSSGEGDSPFLDPAIPAGVQLEHVSSVDCPLLDTERVGRGIHGGRFSDFPARGNSRECFSVGGAESAHHENTDSKPFVGAMEAATNLASEHHVFEEKEEQCAFNVTEELPKGGKDTPDVVIRRRRHTKIDI